MSIKTGATPGTKIKKSVSINLSDTGVQRSSSKSSKTNIRSRQNIPEPPPPVPTAADYLLKRSLSDMRKKDQLPPLKDSNQENQDRRTFQRGWPDDMYVDRQLQSLMSPSPSLINDALIASGHMVKFSDEIESNEKEKRPKKTKTDSGSEGSDESKEGDSSVGGKAKKSKKHRKSEAAKIDEEDDHFDPNRPKSSRVKGHPKGKDYHDGSVDGEELEEDRKTRGKKTKGRKDHDDDGDEEYNEGGPHGKRKKKPHGGADHLEEKGGKVGRKKGRRSESVVSDDSDKGTDDGGKGKRSKRHQKILQSDDQQPDTEDETTEVLRESSKSRRSSDVTPSTRSEYSSGESTGETSSEEHDTEGADQGKKRRGQIQFYGADERARSGRRGTLLKGRDKKTGTQADGSPYHHRRRHRGSKKSSLKSKAGEQARPVAFFSGWDMGSERTSGTSDHLPDEADSVQSLLKVFRRSEYNREEDKYKTVCSIDPVREMHVYLAKHNLNDLIEYLFFVVAKEKPAQPLDFLIQLVGIIKYQQGIHRQASAEVQTNLHWYQLTNQASFIQAISTPRLLDSTPYLPRIQSNTQQKKGSDDTTSSFTFEPFPLRRTKYLLPGSPHPAVSLTNSERVLPKKKDSNKKYSQP